MTVFRVHYASGVKIDIGADDARAATTEAKCQRPNDPVTKVKRLREKETA